MSATHLNGRLQYMPRTMQLSGESQFVAAEIFGPDSAVFAPHKVLLDSYCCRDSLLGIVEQNVPRAKLKFHRLTEGPAVVKQVMDRFGDKTFVKAAHVAGYMRRLVHLAKKGQEGEFAATVTFFVQGSGQVIPVRVGLFEYHDEPEPCFSFGATHQLPTVYMGLIAHY